MVQVGIQVLGLEVVSKLEEVSMEHWRNPPTCPSFSFSALSLAVPPAETPLAALAEVEVEDLQEPFQVPETTPSSCSADSAGLA